MNNRSSCSLEPPRQAIKLRGLLLCCVTLLASMFAGVPRAGAGAGDAPAWMHALVSVPLPPHDEKTDAVQLYTEKIVTVQSTDKIKTLVRVAYKILRPGGRDLGTVAVSFNSTEKITSLRAWRIPAQGQTYGGKD